jgi:hypothetical protein
MQSFQIPVVADKDGEGEVRLTSEVITKWRS